MSRHTCTRLVTWFSPRVFFSFNLFFPLFYFFSKVMMISEGTRGPSTWGQIKSECYIVCLFAGCARDRCAERWSDGARLWLHTTRLLSCGATGNRSTSRVLNFHLSLYRVSYLLSMHHQPPLPGFRGNVCVSQPSSDVSLPRMEEHALGGRLQAIMRRSVSRRGCCGLKPSPEPVQPWCLCADNMEDVFSLCCLLSQLLCGDWQLTFTSMLHSVLSSPPPQTGFLLHPPTRASPTLCSKILCLLVWLRWGTGGAGESILISRMYFFFVCR